MELGGGARGLLARYGEERVIVRLMKRGARVYTCVGPYERHEAWTQKGGDGRCLHVVGRHRWRGLLIGVCQKGVLETMGE